MQTYLPSHSPTSPYSHAPLHLPTHSVRDLDGRTVVAKEVSVNQPLRFGGVTAYQTDWEMAAVTLHATGSPLQPADDAGLNLPMASLEGAQGVAGKLYATFLPAEDPAGLQPGATPRGVSLIARDLQTIAFYDSKGTFVGVRRPGSGKAIEVEGMSVVVDAILCSSGLELKSDPGVPLVYAGFGGVRCVLCVCARAQVHVWC
jgi:cytochrome c biogenesis protein